MGLCIDLHVHTRLHSSCSHIDPPALIRQGVKAGLDGLVITEHQYQWTPEELEALVAGADAPGFLVLAGFEYSSTQGDVLIYGLPASAVSLFKPGMPPEQAVRLAHDLGGTCVAAHPTRAGMGFDERIASMPLDAIEVQSMNLQEHEQRLAAQLAAKLNLRPVAASDAHLPEHVGRYATEFDDVIRSMEDLQESFRRGTFRPVGNSKYRMGAS